VNDQLPLPDISKSWAWAHVQANTPDDYLEPEEIEQIIADSPETITSRLICPRRLVEGVLYNAFIVPTFESGRLAGLGELTSAIDSGNEPSLLQYAWDLTDIPQTEVRLPYYFKWEFRTGARGDFEYLVRLLEPRVIDKRVGKRHINCRDPGYQRPSVVVDSPEEDTLIHSLGLEGALRSLQTKSTVWPTSDENDFQTSLACLLNKRTTWIQDFDEDNQVHHDSLLILPPLYGAWHDARSKVDLSVLVSSTEENKVPTREWFGNLNLDPRHRTSAGFGTLVVQDQQEDLMASAWEQAGAVLEANQRLRQAQLALQVGEKLYNCKLAQLSTGNFLSLTAKLQSRILVDSEVIEVENQTTVSNLIHTASQISSSVLYPAFRRISRPLGPLRSTQNDDSVENRASLLERLNNGEIAPAGPPPDPPGTINLNDLSEATKPPGSGVIDLFGARMKWLLLVIITILAIGLVALLIAYRFATGLTGLEFIIPYIVIAIAIVVILLRKLLPLYFGVVLSKQMTPEYINADALRTISIRPDMVIHSPPLASPEGVNLFEGLNPHIFLNFSISACARFLDRGSVTITPFTPISLQAIQQVVLNSLRPRDTLFARLRAQFRFVQYLSPDLNPIRVGPYYPQPMYEPLRDLSHEYLLPGLEFIPQNTLGLLETNRKFIESYMLGLNTEMARELLWREFPSPLDATYFKQFWDVKEFVPTGKLMSSIEDELKKRHQDIPEEEWENHYPDEMTEEIADELEHRLENIGDIHNWYRHNPRTGYLVSSQLGENPPIVGGVFPSIDIPKQQRKLVLLIRGDLLKKYPTAVIYAVHGKWVDVEDENDSYLCEYNGKRYIREPIFDDMAETKTPIFRGTLPPEITFLGFDLVEDDARGKIEIVSAVNGNVNIPDNNPGWYFVIEERVGESRFGIDEQIPVGAGADDDAIVEDDEGSDWDDLIWPDINHEPNGYIIDRKIDPDNELDPAWDSNSAIRASILLQKPVRIATHADDMMPKEEASED